MERLGFPGSQRLRRILEYLMTPEVARIAEALPGTAAEVAEKTGLKVQQVTEALDDLFYKGVAFPRGDYGHREYYRFARSITQLHDASQASKGLDYVKDRPYYEAWQDFVMNEMYPRTAKAVQARGVPGIRVVPAYKAIKDLPGVLPHEDYRELVKAQNRYSVVKCSCRYRTTAVGEHCQHTSEEEVWHCLQFNRSADYSLAREAGRELTLDQLLELVDVIEDDGLVHIWPNTVQMAGVNVACNCCRDCCMTYVPMDQAGLPIGLAWQKSRYAAYVSSTEECTGCQDCIDRCQFDAIEMKKVPGSKKMKAFVDEEKCFGCGACVVKCEAQTLKMKVVRPPEFIPEMGGAAAH